MILRKIKDLDPFVHFVFFVSIILLLVGLMLLYNKTRQLSDKIEREEGNGVVTLNKDCDEECKGGILSEVKKMISDAVATVASIPKSTSKVVTSVATKGSTTYIPLGGTATTTSTGWEDITNTEVVIDFENDYGKDAKVSWEAFLKVAHGNGKAFARLFDATHGTAVDGSEISISTASSTLVFSGEVRPWSGRNKYRVQLKSLNSFVVTYDSGKIKVSY